VWSFDTAEQRDDMIYQLSPYCKATDEQGVVDFYDMSTAQFCMPLASALALHPKTSFLRWTSLLHWTESAGNAAQAINGRLCFTADDDGDDDDDVEGQPGGQRKSLVGVWIARPAPPSRI
jgi:hypothetical protein